MACQSRKTRGTERSDQLWYPGGPQLLSRKTPIDDEHRHSSSFNKWLIKAGNAKEEWGCKASRLAHECKEG